MPAFDPAREVVQQGALADAHLTAEDGDTALPGLGVGYELVERLTLGPSSE
jgi:hypothetical protein